ncbi:hypothetical protein KP509_01G006200 [Ceratopteris richardii]|uniref:Pentatricopeptide repeat-containing protein n=1 Tax=Ceratopteris richardii TaxID=49495 RepID=A0A8T2VE73_CERRI|nr:hypothetical protein KP509_01G006200 [Ceratopteris richardii]
MYAKCNDLTKAQVLQLLSHRNATSCNAIIGGYCQAGHIEHASICLEHLKAKGLFGYFFLRLASLRCPTVWRDLQEVLGCHIYIGWKALTRCNSIENAMIDMYARCGMLAKAKSVFSKLKVRDRVSWNALIGGHVEQEQGKKALILYKQMRTHDVSPDVLTYTCALRACGTIGAIDEGIQIHNELKESGIGKKDVFIGSALVDMYSKCGALVKADEVFNQLPYPDALTWTALITGYAQQAEIDIALSYFDRMRKAGVKPDQITFLSALTACNHAGLVDKG